MAGHGTGLISIGSASALDDDLLAAVEQATATAESGDGVVLELHPGGGHQTWPGDVAITAVNRWERALRRLERVPAPVVAVASGRCTGPAAEVLLIADFRIVTRDFVFALGANGGAWPGAVLHRVACQLGVARARQLALWRQPLTASKAMALGLVDELADDLRLALRRAEQLLDGIEPGGGEDFAVVRRLLLDAPATSVDEALGSHLAAADRLLRRPKAEPVVSTSGAAL
ncbi:Enoyl-CoA hydratase/isomerase [Kribbella flavida DSM 17836]|uniref:Enoyl-CoA hydratase/isomerase n=1 Tax=Kribbella flavida (strain DSM 17836 / JCM 10339 / NBRC 14399) TaxID=479435 RepID=D2PSP0_KRIFD|nr:enoyl-CoA-hydratase DpgB [Kribbella flavida]ADB33178.1 Enoyl-CoA hydratase/isomerase [Kribbella flavida DSM 17836]